MTEETKESNVNTGSNADAILLTELFKKYDSDISQLRQENEKRRRTTWLLFVVNILIAVGVIFFYHYYYAYKIATYDMKGYISSIQKDFTDGKIDSKQLEEKIKEAADKIKHQPPRTIVFFEDVVLNEAIKIK